jgi:Ca2+-binding RTX toxin-like protein
MGSKPTNVARLASRFLLVAGLAGVSLGLTVGTASAAVNSTLNGSGVLSVTADAGDTIAIICTENMLLINGGFPGSGPANCDAVTLINLMGDAGNNTVDLSGVTGVDFPLLVQANINGGSGNDTITGTAVMNQLTGGPGNDTMTGGPVNDFLSGGLGNDTLSGSGGSDKLLERADVNFTLTDAALTGLGADTLASIERAQLAGGTGPNTIDASAFTGSTVLSGGRGDDVLTGGTGPDLLRSSSGQDTLSGGAGADKMNAGTGDDTIDSVDSVSGNDVTQADKGIDRCALDIGDVQFGCETWVS